MPTIRIDSEVYNWLKSQAIPFEDTPNSVLRRIAGLDNQQETMRKKLVETGGMKLEANQPGVSMKESLDAKQLMDLWGIKVKHGLYSNEGTWYQNLKGFPGALFDYNGYIIFETGMEYENSPYLNIGKETNVHHGISNIPGYKRMRL